MPLRPVLVRVHLNIAQLRTFIARIHFCLGLIAGLFLIVLGLTGSVIAFESDIDHWIHPELWYVTPRANRLSQDDLVSIAQNRFEPARVFAVQFPRASNLAEVMRMTDATIVYLDPYDGTVLGTTVGLSKIDRLMIAIHQVHVSLLPDPAWSPALARYGSAVVTFTAFLLFFLVPTGVLLCWRGKRLPDATPGFQAPWFLFFHEAHRIIGIYASLFLWIASITGLLIGFDAGEKLVYTLTRSSPPAPLEAFRSTPAADATPLMADQALAIARRAMPNASVDMMFMPTHPRSSFTVLMRVPEETSQSVHSSVTVDQYSGAVLDSRNYLTDSLGYRVIRFNRSIHNGDIFGFASHVVVSLSGLLLAALVVTGLVIWWKRLAIETW